MANMTLRLLPRRREVEFTSLDTGHSKIPQTFSFFLKKKMSYFIRKQIVGGDYLSGRELAGRIGCHRSQSKDPDMWGA